MRMIDAHDLWSDIMMLPHNGDMISSEEVEQAIMDAPTVDAVEVVRCKDCDVPHNKWTGCPNLNGLVPPPRFLLCKRRTERQMSESREKKRRYNLRLEYIQRFVLWLGDEPPMWMFWKWRKWKRNRPVWDYICAKMGGSE